MVKQYTKKEWREYMKKWREKNPDKKYEKTYQERLDYYREYNRKNKEKLAKRKKEYYQANKDYFKKKATDWYFRNKEKRANEWKDKRLKVLQHYGMKCSCCGETQIEFLAIDHIKNDGAEHRRTLKINIYDWLIKNNYPKGFQILCHNCNLAKAFYGKCPHQK